MMAGVKINNLDDFMMKLMADMPLAPKRYELRCHPDVFAALRMAEPAWKWPPPPPGTPGRYGSADIVVRPDLGSGGWELYENGELLKSGRLGAEREATTRAYVNPGEGITHLHGTDEPGWLEHNHAGGGIPHEHDPETGFQVPLADRPDSN